MNSHLFPLSTAPWAPPDPARQVLQRRFAPLAKLLELQTLQVLEAWRNTTPKRGWWDAGKLTVCELEHGPFLADLPKKAVIFSMAMLVYHRVDAGLMLLGDQWISQFEMNESRPDLAPPGKDLKGVCHMV